MSSYCNMFGGGVINNSNSSYIALTVNGNITLSWVTDFQNINTVVYNIMDITASGVYNITMPDATKTSVGQTVLFTNVGGVNSFSVLDNSGSNIFTLAAGNARYLYLTSNATPAGTWRSVPFAAGGPSVTSVGATSSTANITITGSPITSSGSFTFNIANDLAALAGFAAGTGVACRTGSNTWSLRTLTGTANQIAITNEAGVSGDPTVALASTITGITSLTVGNIVISANTIGTTNAGTITLGDFLVIPEAYGVQFDATNGTNYNLLVSGNQSFNQTYVWPTTAPATDQVLQYGGASTLQWATVTTFGGPSTVNAIAKYSNSSGSLENSGVLIDGSNNVTGANSLSAANLDIGVADANTISSISSNIKIIPNGANTVQIGVASGVPNDLVLMNGSSLVLNEPAISGSNFSSFAQPAISSNIFYDLPTVPPAVGNYMRINGTTPSTNPDMIWDDSVDNPNFLVNGSMAVWQRGTSFTSSTFFPNNNNVYTADCWKLQSNGNNVVSISQDIGPDNLISCCTSSWKATVVSANKKFGIVQFIEHDVAFNIIGFNTSLAFAAQASGITNLRCALIQWFGATDAPTSNIVSAWNASGTNPTLAAGWTYSNLVAGSIVNIPITSSWANYTVNPDGLHYYGPLGGLVNLAVFIWVDDTTIAMSSTLNLSAIKFEQGKYSTRFIAPSFADDLKNSKRYFQQDLPYGAATGTTGFPATPTSPITGESGCYWPVTSPVLTGVAYAKVHFEVEMRTAPTFVAYPWTTTTNTQRWSDNTGTDLAALSASTFALDSKGALIYNDVAAAGSLTTGGASVIIGHWYADAGFNS